MKFRIILAFATSLFFASQAAFAEVFYSDKTISTPITNEQEFGEDNLTLTISRGGNILSAGTGLVTTLTDGMTNLNVVVDADSGDGN